MNTGWSGGPYGTGERMSIRYSRALLKAAISGELDDATYRTHPVFGLAVPTSCPGVPQELLDPRETWADKEAYDVAAQDLAARFAAKFAPYAETVHPDVAAAGPQVGAPSS